MTDLEWARAFVGCEIKGTGIRFNDTVEVLVNKLAEVRKEAASQAGAMGSANPNCRFAVRRHAVGSADAICRPAVRKPEDPQTL